MVKDALGRETKPGDHVVYAASNGGHRIALRRGLVLKTTSSGDVGGEIKHKITVLVSIPADSPAKPVTVYHPDRLAVVEPPESPRPSNSCPCGCGGVVAAEPVASSPDPEMAALLEWAEHCKR